MQNSLLDGLVQRLGATANAATMFGAPVERGDITVLPFAKAAYALWKRQWDEERRRRIRGRWWALRVASPRIHRDSTRRGYL